MAMAALLLWALVGIAVWQIQEMRDRIAIRESDLVARDERDRLAAELQSLMRDTRDDRAALEQLTTTDALAAAATIEAAGRQAGVTVEIGGAVSSQLQGAQAPGLREVTVVANAEGEFSSLLQAASLFESLPFPSRIDSYELHAVPPIKGVKDPWRMSARIRILIPSDSAL